MSIIRQTDKRTGVTYVYESESYWDKEKQQPRSRRTLIGKVDAETGEVVPTGKSGRKKTRAEEPAHSEVKPLDEHIEMLKQKDAIIKELKAENAQLKREKNEILSALQNICIKLSE